MNRSKVDIAGGNLIRSSAVRKAAVSNEFESADSNYLNVSAHSVATALAAYLPEELRVQWLSFAKYIIIAAELKTSLHSQSLTSAFDAASTAQPESRFDFLNQFLPILESAGYRPLSASNFADAVAVSYRFTQPYKVQACKLDESVFSQYFATHEYNHSSAALPEFGRRILIYVRGSKQDCRTDFFVAEKIDIVCVRIVDWASSVALSAMRRIKQLAFRVLKKKKQGAADDISHPLTPQEDVKIASNSLENVPAAQTDPAAAKAPGQDAVAKSILSSARSTARRVTLESQLKTQGFSAYFSKLTTFEPMFENVVLLWNDVEEPASSPSKVASAVGSRIDHAKSHIASTANTLSSSFSKSSLSSVDLVSSPDAATVKSSQERSFVNTSNNKPSVDSSFHTAVARPSIRSTLRIASYTNVPYGDVDACFPALQVRLRPVDRAVFYIQVFVLVGFVLQCIFKLLDNNKSDDLLVLFLCGELLHRLYAVMYSYVVYCTVYERDRANWLDEREDGKGKAAVATVSEQMRGQISCGALLAAFWIWHSAPGTAAQQLTHEHKEHCVVPEDFLIHDDVLSSVSPLARPPSDPKNGSISVADINSEISKFVEREFDMLGFGSVRDESLELLAELNLITEVQQGACYLHGEG